MAPFYISQWQAICYIQIILFGYFCLTNWITDDILFLPGVVIYLLLSTMKKYLCSDYSEVRFSQCSSGAGEEGKKLNDFLHDYFGERVKITLFKRNVTFIFGFHWKSKDEKSADFFHNHCSFCMECLVYILCCFQKNWKLRHAYKNESKNCHFKSHFS